MKRDSPYLPIVIAVIWGIPIFLFGASELLARATVDVSGRVQSAEVRCVQPANNRCTTFYVLIQPDGTTTRYTAGPVDHALARDIPIGATLQKRGVLIDYQIDNRTVSDFPWQFYALACTIGGLIFVIGLELGSRRIKSRQKNAATK